MTINSYTRPLLKWWRLIVVATALSLVASAISSMFQADSYVSRTTLVVGKTFLDPNPDSGQIFIAQHLAGIYADMALRDPIQSATKEALGIDWLPSYHAEVIPNTQMVQVSVTDTHPQRAQIIANELANQLMLQSPTISDTETGERQDFIKEQLSSLENQIERSEKTIEELETSLVGLNSASQIANIESQISEELAKLDRLRANYASFLASSQEGAVNILSVLEPASLPSRPSNANQLTMILLAGLVGLSLGSGTAYLLEYLDRTIKNTADVERIFNLPVIGYISEIPDSGSKPTYVAENPNSILAENFRLLYSNIEFFRAGDPIKTILITSPSEGNGKTTIALNLALSISQAEQEVILVDADLRRPAIHKYFKMSSTAGLSDVISNRADIKSVIRTWKTNDSLKVITAGSRLPNMTEISSSKRISAVLSDLKENHALVIVDAPPLIIADSYNLASRADAVIIILEPGQTTEDQAKAIKEQLDRAHAKVLGFVFNKVSEESAHSYGDYQFQFSYSAQYYSDTVSATTEKPAAVVDARKLIDFFEHGRLPSQITTDVRTALTAIKSRPRGMLSRMKKSKGNGTASTRSSDEDIDTKLS